MIDLITIDKLFRRLIGEAVNPRPLLPATFLLRSHSAYLSACGAVMAGQLHDAWALLRVCLEQGGYAYYVGDDQQRWERWMRRHDPRSPSQKDKWNTEFTHGKVVNHIKNADAGLANAYRNLYNLTIDYGAHPNERGTSVSMNMKETEDGGVRFETTYLHSDGLILDFLLKTTVQVGICVLHIAQVIYPRRSQATGVKFQLEVIAKRF